MLPGSFERKEAKIQFFEPAKRASYMSLIGQFLAKPVLLLDFSYRAWFGLMR